MRTALVTGITGQDGGYLARHLLAHDYRVVGAYRHGSKPRAQNLNALGIRDDIELIPLELLETTNLLRIVDKYRPDEVYNLAAQSFVAVSFEQPLLTSNINALGTMRLLEAIRAIQPEARFYQASTSEMFGRVHDVPQTEETPFYPRSPYGVAKLFAHWATVNYRESHDLFACSGILFNHESPLRGPQFVTRKITQGIARIETGKQSEIVLGNLSAKRDWGYASEYVEAMWLMLQQDEPDDFVVASGETRTVREFVEAALAAAGREVEWKGEGIDERGIDKQSGKTLIRVSEDFYRPAEVDLLLGDPSKAEKALGWQRKTSFEELVRLMVEADLALERGESPSRL